MGEAAVHEPINEAVISMISNYEKADYEIIFVTGNKHYESIKSQIQNVDTLNNVRSLTFY